MSFAQDTIVYYVRNKCLGGEVRRGKSQKPFNGDIAYDYIMWIDSDIVFKTEDFYNLLTSIHNKKKNIVAGLYMMQGGNNFAAVQYWDEEYFKIHGTFKFMDLSDIQNKRDLIEVDYSGFGWIIIRRGVFESLEYPWFRPIFHEIGNCFDFSSEDTAFCRLVKEKGFKIYVDPTVRVGHKKSIIY
jgi:GT2 family glycosyltransferase